MITLTERGDDDLKTLARMAAEWEYDRLGLQRTVLTGLTIDSLILTFRPLIEALARNPDMLQACLRRQFRVDDQHA